MDGRGTDAATERRRLRTSDDDDEDAVGDLLAATFWVTGEALMFGLPALIWTMLTGDVETTFVTTVALAAACLVGGAVRFRRANRERERSGDRDEGAKVSGGSRGRSSKRARGWPPMTPRLAALRFGYYNAALLGAVAAGEALATESVVRVAWAADPFVGPAAVAGLLAGLAAWSLPKVAAAVQR